MMFAEHALSGTSQVDIMKMNVVVLILFLAAVSTATPGFPKWDHISATFGKFTVFPMNEVDAINEGWTLHADNCEDYSGPFVGKRYILYGDYATLLIYDVNGQIAGVQTAFKAELMKENPGRYGNVYQRVKEVDGDYYYVTAYFAEPKDVCCYCLMRPRDVIGDKLMFLIDEKKHIEVPLLIEDVVATKWMAGRCWPGMGTHYWYDISKNMDIRDTFPAFVLYNRKGQLIALGFIYVVKLQSERYEYPPSAILERLFYNATMPTSIQELGGYPTQHIYFTKVGTFSHGCD